MPRYFKVEKIDLSCHGMASYSPLTVLGIKQITLGPCCLCPYTVELSSGVSVMTPNCVRLAPNGTNLGLFKIGFSTFYFAESKCTETDYKESQMFPI